MVAGALATIEYRTHTADRAAGRARTTRFTRRLSGALVIAAIALLVHFGPTTVAATASREEIERLSYYWVSVVALALVAIALACWDVLDSVRHLGHHFSDLEKEEIDRLRTEIVSRKKKSDQPGD